MPMYNYQSPTRCVAKHLSISRRAEPNMNEGIVMALTHAKLCPWPKNPHTHKKRKTASMGTRSTYVGPTTWGCSCHLKRKRSKTSQYLRIPNFIIKNIKAKYTFYSCICYRKLHATHVHRTHSSSIATKKPLGVQYLSILYRRFPSPAPTLPQSSATL